MITVISKPEKLEENSTKVLTFQHISVDPEGRLSTVASDPTPPNTEQQPHQGQDGRCCGNGVAGVAQVAVAATVGEL